MKLDRIILDFADWLRQLLWHRNESIKVRPYDILEQKRCKFGILQKVDRPTPRAVTTYIFAPFRYGKPQAQLRDIHLCCDHLGAIKGEKAIGGSGRGAKQKTHRISVYSASHLLAKDGSYDLRELFSGDYDLQGSDPIRDRQANLIMGKLAHYLQDFKPNAIDWSFEVQATIKEVMHGTWRSSDAANDDLVIEGTLIDRPKPRRARITIKYDKPE